jgi:transposase InsO family protein
LVKDWALEAELAVAALRMAMVERKPPPGLAHHSDRGVPDACQAYTEMLKAIQCGHQPEPQGEPDNAACESFMKNSEKEEIYRNEYRDFYQAHSRIFRVAAQAASSKARLRYGFPFCVLVLICRPALSLVPGHIPAQLAACPLVGNTPMSVPISAMTVHAINSSKPGTPSNNSINSRCGSISRRI